MDQAAGEGRAVTGPAGNNYGLVVSERRQNEKNWEGDSSRDAGRRHTERRECDCPQRQQSQGGSYGGGSGST